VCNASQIKIHNLELPTQLSRNEESANVIKVKVR
jgi:hypothetical protein